MKNFGFYSNGKFFIFFYNFSIYLRTIHPQMILLCFQTFLKILRFRKNPKIRLYVLVIRSSSDIRRSYSDQKFLKKFRILKILNFLKIIRSQKNPLRVKSFSFLKIFKSFYELILV